MSNKLIDKIIKIKNNLLKAGDDYEDMEGMSIVDNPDEDFGDEADQWLAEQESSKDSVKRKVDSDKKENKSRMSKWTPRDDYSEKHKEDIQRHMNDGYSHREASRMAGAHQERGEHHPDMPSDKMLEMLRPYAKAIISKGQHLSDLDADSELNPIKALRGQKNEASSKHYGSLNEAMAAHEKELEDQGMDEDDIADAMDDFRSKWHSENPDHISDSSKHMQDHTDMHEKTYRKIPENFKEQEKRIAGIGTGSSTGMSDAAGMQHAGLSVSDEGVSGGGIGKTPEQRFAESNPDYVKQLQTKHTAGQKVNEYKHLMSDEQKDRHMRLRSSRSKNFKKPNKAFTED